MDVWVSMWSGFKQITDGTIQNSSYMGYTNYKEHWDTEVCNSSLSKVLIFSLIQTYLPNRSCWKHEPLQIQAAHHHINTFVQRTEDVLLYNKQKNTNYKQNQLKAA